MPIYILFAHSFCCNGAVKTYISMIRHSQAVTFFNFNEFPFFPVFLSITWRWHHRQITWWYNGVEKLCFILLCTRLYVMLWTLDHTTAQHECKDEYSIEFFKTANGYCELLDTVFVRYTCELYTCELFSMAECTIMVVTNT